MAWLIVALLTVILTLFQKDIIFSLILFAGFLVVGFVIVDD